MPTDFPSLVGIFIDLIATATGVLGSLAVLVFFLGLVRFIFKAGDAKAVEEGKSLMIWGVVALFVMVSIWGILRFFYGELEFSRPFGFPFLPI